MVQSTIDLPEEVDKVLDQIRLKYGLKTKGEAISKAVLGGGNVEIDPEYAEKIKEIEDKGDFVEYDSVGEWEESLKNAED